MGNLHGKQRISPFVDMDDKIRDRVVTKPRVLQMKDLVVETSKDILDMSTTTCNSDGRSYCSRRTSYRSETSGGNFMLSAPTSDYDAVLEELKLRLQKKALSSQTLQRKDSHRRAFGGRSLSRRGTASPTQSFHGRSLDVILDTGMELDESNTLASRGLPAVGLVPPIQSVSKVGDDNFGKEQLVGEIFVVSEESLMSHRQNVALRDSNGLITIPASCLGLDSVYGGILSIPADDEYKTSGVTKNTALLLKMKSMNVNVVPPRTVVTGGSYHSSHHNQLYQQRRKSSFLTIMKPPMEMVRSTHESSASLSSIVDYFVGRSAH